MKYPKAMKISLTSELREYLTNMLRCNRKLNEDLLKVEKKAGLREHIIECIARDTMLIKKIDK